MIKICARCRSTWAGGLVCEDCGAELTDPYADEARAFPESTWGYIRLQYGARRGMLVRVMAILLGPTAAFLVMRQAFALPAPWRVAGVAGAIALGLATWAAIHWFAGKAVRLWVLRRERVHKLRLARALLRRAARQVVPGAAATSARGRDGG